MDRAEGNRNEASFNIAKPEPEADFVALSSGAAAINSPCPRASRRRPGGSGQGFGMTQPLASKGPRLSR